MPKFNVTFSLLRWEHLETEIEADSLEAAKAKAEALRDSDAICGGNDEIEEEWNGGDAVGDIEVEVRPVRVRE